MTAGRDTRPVTANGSIRQSDVQHQRNMRTAEIGQDDFKRREARALVLEEIEDFEHKLGWRMRSRLGPNWEQLKQMEEQEERTMGLSKTRLPRPPSPIAAYDYTIVDYNANFGPVTPRSPNSLVPVSPRSTIYSREVGRYMGETMDGGWGTAVDRPATGYENARSVFVVTRNSQRASSRLKSPQQDGQQRPHSQGSVLSGSHPGYRSTKQRLMSSMRGVQTGTGMSLKNGAKMDMWTAQSMLEPIFLPYSATQRIAAAKAPLLQSISQRLEKTGNARRWEDGPGQKFWEVQERNLRGAMLRSEGQKLQNAQTQGGDWQRQREERTEHLSARIAQKEAEAARRKDYYPHAKIFQEARMRDQMKAAWETRERRRLQLGMSNEELVAESSGVADETAKFDARLAKMHGVRGPPVVRYGIH